MPTYVELRARSAFSFLEGGSSPEDLIISAAELDHPAIAIMDRDGLYGAPRFHMAAKKAGIRAHIGAEITTVNGRRAPLLCENQKGYQNLCRLITRMKLRVPKNDPKRPARATLEDLEEFKNGLICLDPHFLSVYGPRNTFAELQRHLDPAQERRNQVTLELARRHELPLLATNGVAYATPAHRPITDALTCLRHYTTLDKAGRLLDRNAERYLKPAVDMERLFADHPEAVWNSLELSQRLGFSLQDLGYEFPRYPVPGVPFPPTQQQLSEYLRHITEEGARERYQPYHAKARQQIERELALIAKLELAGYFLIVWDIVNFCRRNNILCQGRGSAANSAVCYSLHITAVDPVGMELLFERFLSEERGEWPDIDIDLPSGDQRERAIQYIYDRYGQLGAAMTANVISYRGRSAAREMGKVLGFDEDICARLSSVVPVWGWKEATDSPEEHFRKAGFDLSDPRYLQFFQLYAAAQDLPRHLGQHSGGMVICQGQLDSVVPLEPASMPGRVVVQWDKEDCADLGLIKVDLLGLGMMAVLEDSIHISRQVYQEEIDLAHLPQDDPQVYAALQAADTVGMFQVESRAQMSSLPRVRPEKFYDLVVQVALIRPGPIVGNMVHPYFRRRQGIEKAECLHPWLEPVLHRTLGVPLFQEQLLRMAMTVANFTGGEAEELRRAMGFKRSEKRMQEIEKKLRSGMTANGITGKTQDTIVQSITSFALYGFPESHAASFALLAYASAWIKTHYPAIFSAAILNNQPMGFYHPATLVKDAQRHGVRFLPVDVSVSDWLCTVLPDKTKPTVRLGLNYVRSLRESTAKTIVARRPFTSIQDLSLRCPQLNKDEFRRLAEIGALNSLGVNTERRSALWEVERSARPAGPLFEATEPNKANSPLVPMDVLERLSADFAGTSLTIGKHPMCYRRLTIPRDVLRAVELAAVSNNRIVKVAGVVIVRQRPGTAKGFVFLSLEDETGISNIILEPDFFEQNRFTITQNAFLLIEGQMQNLYGVLSVKARKVEALPSLAAAPSHDFH